jgi:hypothetical protein
MWLLPIPLFRRFFYACGMFLPAASEQICISRPPDSFHFTTSLLLPISAHGIPLLRCRENRNSTKDRRNLSPSPCPIANQLSYFSDLQCHNDNSVRHYLYNYDA